MSHSIVPEPARETASFSQFSLLRSLIVKALLVSPKSKRWMDGGGLSPSRTLSIIDSLSPSTLSENPSSF